MPGVHRVAATGYKAPGVAALYARLRPYYPEKAILSIFKDIVGPKDQPVTITDLAAGTGKLTSAILEHVPKVMPHGVVMNAVEPVDEFRNVIQKSVPHLEGKNKLLVHKGTSTTIPLGDNSQDALFVGQVDPPLYPMCFPITYLV